MLYELDGAVRYRVNAYGGAAKRCASARSRSRS